MPRSSYNCNISLGVCYGAMTLFTTVLQNVFLLYHVDMFVSVYKIDKTSFWIGETIFLLWNSFNDPLFGWMSDRHYLTSGKDGGSSPLVVLKRLAVLQWNGPLLALSFCAFWISWAYPALQFVVCLCMYDGFLSMIEIHHSALLADMAVSADIRTRLNFHCSVFSALGSVSVFLSYVFWNKENLDSFRTFCFILAAFSFVGFFICSKLLKRAYLHNQKHLGDPGHTEPHSRELHDIDNIGETQKLKTFLKQLLSHRNFLWFAAMNLVQVFHCHFNSNFFPLFLENLLESPSLGSFLIGISFVAPHINNLYFLSLCRRYGVYAVIRLLFAIKLVLSLIMFFMGPQHVWMLCLFIASNRVFTEGTCKLLNLAISDLVDEDFVLHRRSQAVSALIFGTTALVSKPGQTLAPLIGTWLLASQTGHDIFQSGNEDGSIRPEPRNLNPEAMAAYKDGCFRLLIYVPVVCALIQLAIWTQFTLHGQRLRWVKSVRAGSEHLAV